MKSLLILIFPLLFLGSGALFYMISMPGKSSTHFKPSERSSSVTLVPKLKRHVETLAIKFGARNITHMESLNATREYIKKEMKTSELVVEEQEYTVQNKKFYNLIYKKQGYAKSDEIIVIGAHYDTCETAPGANDNGTGVASLIELARMFKTFKTERTIHFVFFTNEEPPFFHTTDMGSFRYADLLKSLNSNVVAMFSLETIGYVSNEKGSQSYPFPLNKFYPPTGNFIAFVGNLNSKKLVTDTIQKFRNISSIPSEGIASPSMVPGVYWSDHWSFWEHGYKAIMITDTAPFRYPHYHTLNDTPDKLSFEFLSDLTVDLFVVFENLANE